MLFSRSAKGFLYVFRAKPLITLDEDSHDAHVTVPVMRRI